MADTHISTISFSPRHIHGKTSHYTESELTSSPILCYLSNIWEIIAGEAVQAVLDDSAVNVSANALWESSGLVA